MSVPVRWGLALHLGRHSGVKMVSLMSLLASGGAETWVPIWGSLGHLAPPGRSSRPALPHLGNEGVGS